MKTINPISFMKTFLIIILFFSSTVFSQSKRDWEIYASQFVSGYFDGWHEAIAYHGWGAGRPFWDYQTSWKRKYKDFDHGDKRAAFFGSKTFLVAFTDGNHMTRGASRLFMTGSIFVAMGEKDTWKERLKEILISALINRIGFAFAYKFVY